MEHSEPKTTHLLNSRHLEIISNWNGDTIATARSLGYKAPKSAVRQLMKNDVFVDLLKRKQESMAEESGRILAHEITVSRAQIINRLWDLAQLPPQSTNNSIYGQIKAAEALALVFDVKIVRTADLDRELAGKTEDEVDFFVKHGYFPDPEEEPPTDEPELRAAPE